MDNFNEVLWMREYEELMFGENHTVDTMTLAANLKLKNMPQLLYKYRRIDENNLDALQNDFLFSSEPRQFNDLLESPIEILGSEVHANSYQKAYNKLRDEHAFLPDRKIKSTEDLINSMADGFGISQPDALELIKNKWLSVARIDYLVEEILQESQDMARNRYNVCCFSGVNDSGAMWANYADNSAGICIGYGLKELNNNLTHLTFPVIYRDNTCFKIDDMNKITGSLCMYALTIKSTDWMYEHEWRTFFPENPPCNKEHMPVPKAVYLGAKISIEDKNKVIDICKKKGISLFQMEVRLGQHKLIPVLIK